ncbi:TetR/AcrR family transcriptional regulator [Actinophytocola sp.]|uniref:TetR/AcrR family transcriptional regulator n=1 Tax=Actinophytocola sp. TaxID=1872138 RepID=UPI0025B96DDA|nr:TetR/AcrR family transcriptional regulator [Actinophytocola sp.]
MPAESDSIPPTTRLFYTRGIHAVGVDLIAEVAGTTKKTLYDRFGSKDALVALYLSTRFERWKAHVEAWLDGHGRGAVQALDALEAWLESNTFGCAFVNANAEIGPDHPAVGVIRAEKEWMRELYERLAEEAGAPAAVGAQLHLLHEGAIIGYAVAAQADALDNARAAARTMLGAGG